MVINPLVPVHIPTFTIPCSTWDNHLQRKEFSMARVSERSYAASATGKIWMFLFWEMTLQIISKIQGNPFVGGFEGPLLLET